MKVIVRTAIAVGLILMSASSRASEYSEIIARAMKGDYVSQGDAAFCLARPEKCEGAPALDPARSCAWRAVVVMSGDKRVVSGDWDKAKRVCQNALTPAEQANARSIAGALFTKIYGKAFPAPLLDMLTGR